MGRRSNRKHSKIDGLAPELKATVEQMLLSDATYAEIVDFLEDNGVSISIASVCRYAQDYLIGIPIRKLRVCQSPAPHGTLQNLMVAAHSPFLSHNRLLVFILFAAS